MAGHVNVANAITLWTADKDIIVNYNSIDWIRNYWYCLKHCYQRHGEKNRLLCLITFA